MRVHIVQKGDTLWKIAKQYAVGFEELKRLNAHLTNPDYIVPGMEIYLPNSAPKKEVQVPHVEKEHQKPMKEIQVQPPKPTPAPTPVPTPLPVPQMQKPLWQGDLYFQPPIPQPMPMPNWQTHVHVQPSIEQNVAAPQPQPQPMPAPQPMPMPMPQPQVIHPQPIYIQQAPQPQQPIFIEQPMMHHCMPQMMPMPRCPHCHRMPMEESMHMLPIMREEESPTKKCDCSDQEQQLQHYYEEIQQMMCMPNPCCHPQMMPYMMPQMHQMPQMHPMHQMPMMPQMHPMHQMPPQNKSCRS